MVVSEDKLKVHLPKKSKPNVIFMGTMCSGIIRHVDGVPPKQAEPHFYYHSDKNMLWEILQYIYEPSKPRILNHQEKLDFTETHSIALINIIEKIEVSPEHKRDSSDEYISKASTISCRKIDDSFKEILRTTPIYFTCLGGSHIDAFIDMFSKQNTLDFDLRRKIDFLASPTVYSAVVTSEKWLKVMRSK
ncbi:hypothetical protein K2P97_07500 [bacterium]|nr:hypothetical protein [bacterium]